jgi:hypothetical protein
MIVPYLWVGLALGNVLRFWQADNAALAPVQVVIEIGEHLQRKIGEYVLDD